MGRGFKVIFHFFLICLCFVEIFVAVLHHQLRSGFGFPLKLCFHLLVKIFLVISQYTLFWDVGNSSCTFIW